MADEPIAVSTSTNRCQASTSRPPGLFIPWMMAFEWQLLARIEGAEAVRIASRAEKTFYLGYTMIASGVLATIAWGTLLPDRRDTLILGSLPARPSLIVTAKLLALAAYVGFVALFMHGVASVSWGMVLGDAEAFSFTLRGIVAHLTASSLASISVCIAVAAAQGLTLSLVGPRHFRQGSTLLQVLFVGLMVLRLAALPAMNSSVVDTLGSGMWRRRSP